MLLERLIVDKENKLLRKRRVVVVYLEVLSYDALHAAGASPKTHGISRHYFWATRNDDVALVVGVDNDSNIFISLPQIKRSPHTILSLHL